MPSRLLREGILTSDRIERLDWAAEVFYRRLMSKVDDYGLFDARPSILRTSLYPLRVDRVREADITRWLAACETAGVIALYEHGGKPFGQMIDTGWATRAEPKQPLPPWGKSNVQKAPENGCKQLQTPVPPTRARTRDVFVVGDEDGVLRARTRSKTRTEKPNGKTSIPPEFSISDRVAKWAKDKGYSRLPERLEHFIGKAKARGYTYADWDEAFMEAIRKDWAELGNAAQSSRRVAL